MLNACPICSSSDPVLLLDRVEVPILMHKLYSTSEAARAAKRGPLAMVGCRKCGFLWNNAFDPSLIDYSDDYENNQTHSAAFSEHLDRRISSILSASAPTINYLEIGCGQGDFMRLLIQSAPDRIGDADGFDTVWRGTNDLLPPKARIHKSYFDKGTASTLRSEPNVVVSRHTIEHIRDPLAFLCSIREALGPTSKAKIFLETPTANWIIENNAIQDFFYEHCSIFTERSLALALRKSGFENPSVERVFGGQYLWATATAGKGEAEAAADVPVDIVQLSSMKANFIDRWSREVAARKKLGDVAIWGAGAKGITFALLIGNHFSHVVDVNPKKQHHFLPGSGIPIVTPEEAAARKPATIFVMNPNYLEEISATCSTLGIEAELIPIN